MSPGPLSSAHRGGFSFQHGGGRHAGGNYGQRFGAPNPGRAYGPQPSARGRFYVDDDGIVLEPGDTLTVTVDDEGDATVTVTGADDGGNGNGEESKRRGLFSRRLDKMAVSSNSDGTITIRPEGDASLQLIGDPLSGAIVVVEIEPEPIEVVDNNP
jgi:hypothetical protein